jgi:methyl-accepting chemotaxis protein PixJ
MLDYPIKKPIQVSISDPKSPASKQPPQPPHKPTSVLQKLSQPWNNLNFRTKLTLLLMVSAALPVIAVTQGLVTLNQDRELNTLKESLQKDGKAFKNEYVLWTQVESESQAENLAKVIEATKINLSSPSEVSAQRAFLQNFLTIQNGAEPESNKNFQILTDAQGRTVAQDVQILAEDFSSNPPLAAENNQELAAPKYRRVSLPTGINLADIPIVKDSLKTKRPLAGMELLKSESLQRLGLEKQANIGLRSQPTKNQPESKQPFPEGTFDTDKGKAGLVAMAVYPIEINNKLVGTVIVGAAQNRNYGLVDKFSQNYKVPTATVFAQDWRVNTNVPYTDGKTRATGTRLAREVAEKVLNQEQEFSGQTNILGQAYVTFYSPLYDHQKELNPTGAKPVGIAYIGQSLKSVESSLRNQQLTAYGIGGGMLALVGLVAIPIAGSISRSLKRLASFAQAVGTGEEGIRLEATERHDEIGVLSQELNQMAINVEANLEARRMEADRSKFFADIGNLSTSGSQDLESLFNQALSGAREFLKADRVVIYRFNHDWSGYIASESVLPGWRSALNDKIEDSCIGDDLIEAYRNGRVVPTNNVMSAGFHPNHQKLMERLQIKANLVTPIVNNDQLYALLIAHHCNAPHEWQPSEIDFLRQLAAQLGLMLDRGSLLEQQRVEAKRAQMIKDMTLHLTQTLQPQEIFDTAVAEIREAIKSDRVVVYSFDQNWKGTVIAESVANGFPRALGAKIDDPCFADRYVEKYRGGRVQATENIYKAGLTPCHLKQLEPFAVKANLVAPILQAGQLLGLLIAHQCSAPRTWQQAEIDLFTQFSTQVGLALDRFHLLEQQKTARELLQRRALELLMEVDPVNKGDLTVRANVTEDEIGTIADSYNVTISNLRKIVSQVQVAAQQVTLTTTNSEGAAQELSKETLRQAEEIATALERIRQMSDSIRAVVQGAAQAEAAVQEANMTVAAGDAAMNRTVDGMLAIRDTVTETSKKVKQLGDSSQKISKVVSLIGRFAAQTNLLALKASIEAARAGDEGRGFAVLADEVRVLARQSAEATAEIESLIANIQKETNEVVVAMEAGKEQVVAGTKLVDETRQNLNKITDVSKQISESVAAIASAATVQSQASAIVTATIADVAESASQTSEEATVVSASFKELLALAQELQTSASQFKVN